jgi:hypothetical protein
VNRTQQLRDDSRIRKIQNSLLPKTGGSEGIKIRETSAVRVLFVLFVRRTYSLPLLPFFGIILSLLLWVILAPLGLSVLGIVGILTLLRLLVLVAVLILLFAWLVFSVHWENSFVVLDGWGCGTLQRK